MTREIEELTLPPQPRGSLAAAMEDIWASLCSWRLWLFVGYRDMQSQYSRSVLGPFWLTAHALAWISALVFIFSNVFELQADLNQFVLYVAFGLVIFNFINAVVTGACDIYIRSRIIIHSHPGPLFIHPLRLVVSSLLQLGFQSLAILPFLVFFPIAISPTAWLVIPGILLMLLMSVVVATVLAIAGARYGDFRFAILAVMRLMFFVTPVFWSLDQWGGLPLQIVTLNPITTFITLIREPLLGNVPEVLTYLKAVTWVGGFSVLALAWFARVRATLSMWV